MSEELIKVINLYSENYTCRSCFNNPNIKKEGEPYEEIINGEFSTIKENTNNEVNPRSHG